MKDQLKKVLPVFKLMLITKLMQIKLMLNQRKMRYYIHQEIRITENKIVRGSLNRNNQNFKNKNYNKKNEAT